MSDNSISDLEGAFRAFSESWDEWEREDDQAQKVQEKQLTAEQEYEYGLGQQEVLLSNDDYYELWRDEQQAYIVEVKTGHRHTIRLEPTKQPRDYYRRWKLYVADIRMKVPAFIDHLEKTRIWDSLKITRPSAAVYVYRVSHALHYKQNIYWDKTAGDAQRYEVTHKDRICCHDHWSNLERTTADVHKSLDIQQELTDEVERAQKRRETGEVEFTAPDVWEATDDTVNRLLELLESQETMGILTAQDKMLLGALRARQG